MQDSYSYTGNKDLWLSQGNLVVPIPENTEAEEKNTKVVVSGTSENGGPNVVSNTAVIKQNPKCFLRPSVVSYSADVLGGPVSIEIEQSCINLDTIIVVSYPSGFVSGPFIEIAEGKPYLKFNVLPNVVEIPKCGTFTISGVDNFGITRTNDELTITQPAGVSTKIEIPEETTIEWNTPGTAVTYDVSGHNLATENNDVLVGIYEKSDTFNVNDEAIKITNATVTNGNIDIAFTENKSYYYWKTYEVSVSGVSEYNEYVYSNTFVIKQKPKSISGAIRLIPEKDVIGYYETTARFTVRYPENITHVGFCQNLSVNTLSGRIDDNTLTVQVNGENTSISNEREITAVVSGLTEDNKVVYGYGTVLQSKAARLLVGDNFENMSKNFNGSDVGASITNKTFCYKADNLSNIGVLSKSGVITSCDILASSQTVKVSFPVNESTSRDVEMFVELSGSTSDGHQETAKYTFKQVKKTNEVLLITDTSGSTNKKVIESTVTSVPLKIQISGYTDVKIVWSAADKNGSFLYYPQVGEEFTSSSNFTANITQNYSYTDTVTYTLRASGRTTAGITLESNTFEIEQQKRTADAGKIYFGNSESTDVTINVQPSGTSTAGQFTVEGAIIRSTIAVDYEMSSGLSDEVGITIVDGEVRLTFPAFPCDPATYKIYLTAKTTTGSRVTSNALIVNHLATAAVSGEGVFLDSSSSDILIECDPAALGFRIYASNVDTTRQPEFEVSPEGVWFIVNTQWAQTTGNYTHYIQSVANVPQNTRVIDGDTIDEYRIKCTIFGLGCSKKEVTLTIRQKRCVEGPLVKIQQFKVDGEETTEKIPYTASTLTWKVTTKNIYTRSAAIQIPTGENVYILDEDGSTNTTTDGEYENISNLTRYAYLWKEKSYSILNDEQIEVTGETDTGKTYIVNTANEKQVVNEVHVSGRSTIDSSTVTGKTNVIRILYKDIVVEAPSSGGTVVLQYESPFPGFVNFRTVTGGTMCENISVDEQNNQILLSFGINYEGEKRLNIYLEKDDIVTNTLIVVQKKLDDTPTLSLYLDTETTMMTDDVACINASTPNATWKVHCTGMQNNTVVLDVDHSINVVGGSGTNPENNCTFDLLSALANITGTEQHDPDCYCGGAKSRKITVVIKGVGLDGMEYTAMETYCQSLVPDEYELQLFCPHNLEYEGTYAYFSVGCKNVFNTTDTNFNVTDLTVEVISGVRDPLLRTENVRRVYNRTGINVPFGNAEYFMKIPANDEIDNPDPDPETGITNIDLSECGVPSMTVITPDYAGTATYDSNEHLLTVCKSTDGVYGSVSNGRRTILGEPLRAAPGVYILKIKADHYKTKSVTVLPRQYNSTCIESLASKEPRVIKVTAQGYDKKHRRYEDFTLIVQKTFVDEPVFEPSLYFVTKEIEVGSSSGSTELTFSYYGVSEIGASSSSPDFTIVGIEGNTLTVRFTENTEVGARTANITISGVTEFGESSGETISDTAVISQVCGGSLKWASTSKQITSTDVTVELPYTAGCVSSIGVDKSGDNPRDFTVSTIGADKVVVSTTENMGSARSVVLTITGRTGSSTVSDAMTLTQEAACQPSVIWTDNSPVTGSSVSTTATLHYSGNCASSYSVTTSDAGDTDQWFFAQDNGDGTVTLSYRENQLETERSVVVTIYANKSSQQSPGANLTFKQEAACRPELSLPSTPTNVGYNASVVNIPYSASCVKRFSAVSASTEGFIGNVNTGTTKVDVNCPINTVTTARDVTIVLTGWNYDYSATARTVIHQAQYPNAIINFTTGNTPVSAESGSVCISYTTQYTDHYSVTTSSGTATVDQGNNCVRVTYPKNEQSSENIINISLSGWSYSNPAAVTTTKITQAPACSPEVDWSPTSVSIDADATSITVNFTGYCASRFEASCDNSHFTPGAAQHISGNNYKVVVTCPANGSTSAITGVLTIKAYPNGTGSAVSDSISIKHEAACSPTIGWDEDSNPVTIMANETSITLFYTGTCLPSEKTVVVTPSTHFTTARTTSSYVKLVCDKNTGTTAIDATVKITVTNHGVTVSTGTIGIRHLGACSPEIYWSSDSYTAADSDTSKTLNFRWNGCANSFSATTSNSRFTVDTPVSASTTGGTCVIRFPVNTTTASTTCTVTIKAIADSGSATATTTFTQSGVCAPNVSWTPRGNIDQAGVTSDKVYFTSTCGDEFVVRSGSTYNFFTIRVINYDSNTGGYVVFDCSENTNPQERSVVLYVKAKKGSAESPESSITLTQLGDCRPEIKNVLPRSISVPATATTYDGITFGSQCCTSVVVRSTDSRITGTTNNADAATLTFPQNTGSTEVTATITIVGKYKTYEGSGSTTISFTQAADCSPSVSWNDGSSKGVSSSTTSVTLGYSASCSSGITVTSSNSAFTAQTPSSTTGNGTVVIKFSENSSVDPRSTDLVITGYHNGRSSSKTLVLTQSGMTVDPKITVNGDTTVVSGQSTHTYTARTEYVTWSGATVDNGASVSDISGSSSATTAGTANVTFKVTFPAISGSGVSKNITITCDGSTTLSASIPGYSNATVSGTTITVCNDGKTYTITVKGKDKDNNTITGTLTVTQNAS